MTSTEPFSVLPAMLGAPDDLISLLELDDRDLSRLRKRATEIDARVEIGRHYGTIHDYLVELFRYQGIDEVVADGLALFPGAEEVTSLLAVEEIARSGRYDFVGPTSARKTRTGRSLVGMNSLGTRSLIPERRRF